MSDVQPLNENGLSRQSAVAARQFEADILQAIKAAKDAGLQQGLIVAFLHAHAHQETADLFR